MTKVEDIKKVLNEKNINIDDEILETVIDTIQKKDNVSASDITAKDTDTANDSKIKMEVDSEIKSEVTTSAATPPETTVPIPDPSLSKKTDLEDEPIKPIAQQKETKPKSALKNKNVIFMGTGLFAGNILNGMIKNCTFKKLTIITQPDKKIGRKKSSIHRTLAPNPVRDLVKENDLDIYQPRTLNEDAISQITKLKPDIIIVASYGKILPEAILNISKHTPINVHASLLPELRGASPVQNALLTGLKKTGITIMKMDAGLDTGEIVVQESTDIQEHEKADELLERLSILGSELLLKVLQEKLTSQKELESTPQDSSKATMCQLIDREDGHIQWTQTTEEIYNKYRALYPWPGIFSYWEEAENQLMRIKLRAIYPLSEELTPAQRAMTAGTVFIGHDQLCIKTFDGAIIVEAVQPECKTVMPVYDFLNGHNTFEGAILK